jgi:hypothetical protein
MFEAKVAPSPWRRTNVAHLCLCALKPILDTDVSPSHPPDGRFPGPRGGGGRQDQDLTRSHDPVSFFIFVPGEGNPDPDFLLASAVVRHMF